MVDCPWDLNGDGIVDDADLTIFKLAYPSKIGDANWNAACDFNKNGEVDNFDFTEFAGHYGTTCPGVTPPPTTGITCNGATPHHSSGCALLKHYDVDDNGIISDSELFSARRDRDDTRRGIADSLTTEEYDFVHEAHGKVSINALCTGCTSTTTPPICTPGDKRCYNGNTVETCNYNGTGWTRQTCSSGYSCIDGVCIKTSEPIPVCTPGEKVCTSATRRKTCKSDGSGWHYSSCPSGYECKNGECVKTTTPTPTPPQTVTLEWVRDNYDSDKSRRINSLEKNKAYVDYGSGKISSEQMNAVLSAYTSQTLLPAYSTPPTPPNMETRTINLSEGQHSMQVSLSGYNTLNATLNVSSSSVSCSSVTGGSCSTSGWTVTTGLTPATTTGGRCAWIATQDTSKVEFISEMVLAYLDLKDIGFVPSAAEIGDAVLMYLNLGTPESLWGC